MRSINLPAGPAGFRLFRSVGLGLALMLAGAAFVAAGPAPGACAQTDERAGVLIQSNPENFQSLCVELGAADADGNGGVSGIEALRATGAEVQTKPSDFGEFVCAIDGIGDCEGTSNYWAYFQAEAGEWKASEVGASSTTVAAGGVEGWRLTEGTAAAATPPSPDPDWDSFCNEVTTQAGEDEGGPEEAAGDTDGVPLTWILVGAAVVVLVVAAILFGRRRGSP